MDTVNKSPSGPRRPPVRILKIPLAFFGLPSSEREDYDRLENLISGLKEELRAQVNKAPQTGEVALTADLLEALRVMPITLYRVGDEFELPKDCAPILDDHAYLMYYAFLSAPAAQPKLEECLHCYPEYLYHLLELNDRRKREGDDPIPLQQQAEFYGRKLLEGGGPGWAIHWLKLNYSEQFHEQILYAVYRQREMDAGCAHCYHWLRTRNKSAEERTAEMVKILPIISTSPWYAIMTAIDYPDIEVEPLIESISDSPFWLYNWLRLVRRGPQEALVENLLASTPWTAQYIADLNPPDAPELLERLRQKNQNSRWTEWLRRFTVKRTPKTA